MKIEQLQKGGNIVDEGIHYFWKHWGNESNFNFYNDCIKNSFADTPSLPAFYVLLDGPKIIGSYALLTNDLISRQDLMPWFACLQVNEDHRNKGFAKKLIQHGQDEAKKRGFSALYLSTTLNNFYEKKDGTTTPKDIPCMEMK